jgi:hypothetical protein
MPVFTVSSTEPPKIALIRGAAAAGRAAMTNISSNKRLYLSISEPSAIQQYFIDAPFG